MDLADRIRANVSDVKTFGPSFLRRHLPRLTGASTVQLTLAGGSIHLRAGESDVAAIRQVFGSRQYDIHGVPAVAKRTDDRLKAILDAGKVPVILDAGANIGAASLWFARRYPAATVVGVEPEPGNFSVLKKNAELEANIVPLHAAIGSNAGFVQVDKQSLGWAAQTTRASSGIPIVTVKECVDRVPNGVLFIAKVDIEGFESDLFSANIEWIDDAQVVFIEPHDWMMPGKRTSRTFQKAMGQHDFELFISGENLTYVR